MSEQEAQQAQTIARIKDEYAKHAGRTYNAFMDFAPLTTELYENLGALLEIVDSQAQKIAEQAKALDDCETRNVKLNQQNDKLRDALAEQAERAKQ